MNMINIKKTVFLPLLSFCFLFLPAVIATISAIKFADWLYDPLNEVLAPILNLVSGWPSLATALVAGDYGLVAMFPFLVLYALPTIVVFSVLLAVYRSSGLIEHLSGALQPWLRPFGLGARDLVRVVMGFGCNVPAIVSSRACDSCSRGTCVSAISFGSACSYQLPATLAVFAAAGMAKMGVLYLILLALTTLVYLRFTTPKALRLAHNLLVEPKPNGIRRPRYKSIKEETMGNLKQFVVMATPVFFGICLVATILNWLGVLKRFSDLLSPVMALFNLPGEAATAVVLGAIRKDGIAIGLLDPEAGVLKASLESPAQVLTAVYLSGVLLPCLVTVFSIISEMRWKFALKLCVRQMAWAAGFSLIIAWGAPLFL